MSPETETIEVAQGRFCKAGFWHQIGDDCDHIVALPAAPRAARALPSIVTDDYYSEEATLARREENKLKYQPGRNIARRDRKLIGNEAKGLNDWK